MAIPDNPPIDISDLPEQTSAGIRSFVSAVREGYHTQRGSWKQWVKAISAISNNSPVLYFMLCVGIGASMRPLLSKLPGGILHLRGHSTTGKSIALQTVLSIRADPADMTWCFDSASTLKWYTIAAQNNFLCLDDLHMAIMPDKGACKAVPPSYLDLFDNGDAAHTTIISTSVPSIHSLHHPSCESAWEIDATVSPFWPRQEGLSPWWMDNWMNELKLNYGHASQKVLDSLSQDTSLWIEMEEQILKGLPKSMHPGKKSILIQAKMGRSWLRSHAQLDIEQWTVYDMLLKQFHRN